MTQRQSQPAGIGLGKWSCFSKPYQSLILGSLLSEDTRQKKKLKKDKVYR